MGIDVSATGYVDKLIEWIWLQIDDESLFPLNPANKYPPDFMEKLSDIFRRLFRVYAHLYTAHSSDIKEKNVEAHVNTFFKHFYFFIVKFDLVPAKELLPLEHIIVKLQLRAPIVSEQSAPKKRKRNE